MKTYHITPPQYNFIVDDWNDIIDHNIVNISGNTYEEMCDDYSDKCKIDCVIGIPHDLEFYLNQFKMVPNIWHQYYFGRLETITRMINDNIIDKNKKHNISELFVPQEIKFYNYIDFIVSVTTNNAVYNGIKLKKYHVLGLQESQWFNEDEINNSQPTAEICETIEHNLKSFDLFIEEKRNVG